MIAWIIRRVTIGRRVAASTARADAAHRRRMEILRAEARVRGHR